MAAGESMNMPATSMMPFNARMISQGSRSVSRHHCANSCSAWTKVMIQPTAAEAMITSGHAGRDAGGDHRLGKPAQVMSRYTTIPAIRE